MESRECEKSSFCITENSSVFLIFEFYQWIFMEQNLTVFCNLNNLLHLKIDAKT